MIWVVTDVSSVADALDALIAEKRYRVETMGCAAFHDRIRFRKPDLIIIDCGIADSFELIALVRETAHARSVPIVMFSTDSPHLREQALSKGADAFVEKRSLDWSELFTEIQRFAGAPDDARRD